MGMFDHVYINIKCPYCGKESEIECQTKMLDCELETWRKGDFVGTTKYEHLECAADCHSDECVSWQNNKIGYTSGFGRIFDVLVKLKNGVVTGEYEIISSFDVDDEPTKKGDEQEPTQKTEDAPPPNPAAEFLKLNGFFQEKENTFSNKTCFIEIHHDYYSVTDKEGSMYSHDLNIYWLIGVLTYRGHLEKNYKQN